MPRYIHDKFYSNSTVDRAEMCIGLDSGAKKLPSGISLTPRPLPRHKSIPAYSLKKEKVASPYQCTPEAFFDNQSKGKSLAVLARYDSFDVSKAESARGAECSRKSGRGYEAGGKMSVGSLEDITDCLKDGHVVRIRELEHLPTEVREGVTESIQEKEEKGRVARWWEKVVRRP